MQKNSKIFFIHGYTSSHTADWYPEVSKLLESEDYDYEIPDFPGGKRPHAEEWLEVMHRVISENDKPLVLVGHSLGTRAVLLYIERFEVEVEKVVLVAPFDNLVENGDRRDGEAYPDFFTHEIDLELVKSRVREFVVLHSRDDGSISFEQGGAIAEKLGAELVAVEGRGHFTEPRDGEVVFEVLAQEEAN